MPEITVPTDQVFPILKENILVDGFHVVMALPAGFALPKQTGGLAPGCEWRTGNTYIVVAPSVFEGPKYSGAYRVIETGDPTIEAPLALLERIRASCDQEPPRVAPTTERGSPFENPRTRNEPRVNAASLRLYCWATRSASRARWSRVSPTFIWKVIAV